MTSDSPGRPSLEQIRALLASRQIDAAADKCDILLASHPTSAQAWLLRGVLHAEVKDIEAARRALERAFAIEPHQAASHHLVYANVLLDASDPAGAESQAELALAAAPEWPPALVALGSAMERQRRPEDARLAYERAIARDRDYARAHLALGALLSGVGQPQRAIEVLANAVERWPASEPVRQQLARAHGRAARALHSDSHVFDAIDEYERALALDGSIVDYWNELGNACADAGLIARARESYRRALAIDPAYHQVESNLLINLHYDHETDAGAMFAAHRAWAQRHAAGIARMRIDRDPRTSARLRVGFLSPALRAGPTASFLLPLLRNLDPARFEAHGIAVDGSTDSITEALRRHCGAWHDMRGRDDEAVAAAIADAGIDILVDLAGHTPGGRLQVLARKPAPIVATWLDYFDTTGMDAVDYLVSDPVSTPSTGPQRFSERVVRIDPCRLCFEPPDSASEPAPPPLLKNGFVTFGSFNRISKLADPVVGLWSRILAAVPRSRLLLKNGALADPRMRGEIVARFAAHGIESSRLELRGHSPHVRMLAEYADVDIALDPFPYNGGLTTCEALWMGVPVLTLAGDSMISRQGASLLAAANLPEWIANDESGYLDLAVTIAGEAKALAGRRAGMRQHLRESPLLDGAAFARGFSALLEEMASASAK